MFFIYILKDDYNDKPFVKRYVVNYLIFILVEFYYGENNSEKERKQSEDICMVHKTFMGYE